MWEKVLLVPCLSASICGKGTRVWEHISAPGLKLALIILCLPAQNLLLRHQGLFLAAESQCGACSQGNQTKNVCKFRGCFCSSCAPYAALRRAGFQPNCQAPVGVFHCCFAALDRGFAWSYYPKPKAELSGFHNLVILHGPALRDLFMLPVLVSSSFFRS